MIVARNLSKSFGKVVAVDSINFRIPRGRVVGFLGPNGAGKTTTIRMIAGFLTPTAGTITVDGVEAASKPREVRRRIGYLPESTPLYPEMRVAAYLRFRAHLSGVARSKRAAAVEGAIQRCGLGPVRRRPIAHISKGYRQRVGLAATLLNDPPVLILDEPTVGLDPNQIREARQLIRSLAGDHTILLSTHILPEAELSCDDIVMMAGGRVLTQGSVSELRDSAARGVRFVVETESADAETHIGALPSVDHVDPILLRDGWTRITVTPRNDADDLRVIIGRTIRQLGASLRELTRETATLEQMFVQLVAGAEAQQSGGPAGPEGDSGRGIGPGGPGAKDGAKPPPTVAEPRAPQEIHQ